MELVQRNAELEQKQTIGQKRFMNKTKEFVVAPHLKLRHVILMNVQVHNIMFYFIEMIANTKNILKLAELTI